MKRSGIRTAVFAVATTVFVQPATAHTGTTHAGTPHWALFTLVLGGFAVAGISLYAIQQHRVSGRFGATALVLGVLLAILGSIGLVEIQVAPATGPQFEAIYPTLAAILGILIVVGSLFLGWRYWPEQPGYTGLGLLLGSWVAYPGITDTGALSNPLGYVVALGVPIAVAYLLYQKAGFAIRRVFDRRPARIAAGVAFSLFTVFFVFSAGTITVNPDMGVNAPTTRTITFFKVAGPLVTWPAVEFYFPAIPTAGFVSVGTLLLISLLGGLIAINAALATTQWIETSTDLDSTTALGAFATSGATACCCCAPAFYAVLGVVFGSAATPVYWAFMDPSSPVGGLFFAISVVVLLYSILRTTTGLVSAGVCRRPSFSGAADA